MIKKSVLAFAALLLCLPLTLQAKVEHLLPKPQQVEVTPGVAFALSGPVSINYADGVNSCALLEEVFTENGCSIAQGGKAVNVSLVASIEGAHDYVLHGYDNEAYTLEITANTINITAVTNTGVIRAAQTLAQLAEGYEGAKALEGLTMKDWPAFKLRGYMHDVGRSFISIDELIKQVELFSRFKINTFHWHMTENQAWRFEVKAYPELTSSASMTRFPGQYYTQEDCKSLLAVAKKHGVVVIPEIDMPGHSEAFHRAMGFDMQSEQGKVVLKKVIDEVVEVFEGVPYIHIGGDEVSTTAAYLNEMLAYAESKSANVKGGLWNPINGIGQDALNHTLAQMWGTRGYLATGKANIDCRYNYTNHFDVFADLVGIYKSNIYYHAQGTPEVAGAISGCWNDRKVADEVAIMAQNNVWANVIATAERTWMGGGKRYIDNMTNTPNNLKVDGGHGGVMLPNSGDEYEEFKSWETRFLFHKANSLKGEPIPYVKQTNVRWRITDAFPNGGSETAAFGPEAAGTTASTELLPEVYEHNGQTYYTGMATGAGIYLAHTWGNSIIDAYYDNPQFNHTAYAWTYVYSPEAQTVGAQIEFQNYSRSEQDGAAPAGKWDHFGSKIWVNGEEIAAPTWDNTGVSVNSKEVMLKNENFPGRKPIQVTLKQGWNKVFLKLPYFNKGYRLKKWMFTCVFTDLEGINAVEGLIYSPNQCMDEATEVVAAKVSEIKRDRGAYVGTSVGLWSETAAAALDAKVAEIEATYSATMTAEERAAQVAALATAWTAFQANLTAEQMNKPVSGSYYRMYTPQRDNRYPTGKGAGQAIIGEQNPATNASIWQFVTRKDGTYNIINSADGTYISPASSNNTALNCVANEPSKGWTLKPASTKGLVTVTSGDVQFNQTNSGQSYKLYNWGSGTNTTDTGCQYALIEATPEVAPENPIPFAIITGLENQTYPYTASKSVTTQAFAQENITIAVDVTMPASFSGHQVFVCAADPTKEVVTSAIGATATPYVAAGINGYKLAYHTSSRDGDVYTQNTQLEASKRYKLVFVFNKTDNTFKSYTDGASEQTNSLENNFQDLAHFASNANAKLYIGGGVTKAGAQETFAGTIHSVHFFDGVLSASEIAKIDYEADPSSAVPTPFALKSAEDFENGGIYTFVTKRGWMGATAESNNVISTARTTVNPAASADNVNFQWTVYKSAQGKYYLYNLGKKKFMGVESRNNTSVPFVDVPTAEKLTFKKSSSAEYPIMFSTDNAGVVNHSPNHGGGLITWTGGWNTLDDDGSNHMVTFVGSMSAEELDSIAYIIDNYNKELYVKGIVEGLEDTNPNTHFGSVRATSAAGEVKTTLKRSDAVTTFKFNGLQETTIDFTREYRGFEFQGFYLGEESLGKSFVLSEDLKSRITEANPIMAKFTTTSDVTLFYDDDEFSYRIPAIATTSTGRIIAVSDYRHNLDDIGRDNHGTGTKRIDLVARTSDDNGKTWSETMTIAAGNNSKEGTYERAFGDAAIAAVGQNIVVMAAAGDQLYSSASVTSPNRMARIFSSDNGQTWSISEMTTKMYNSATSLIPNGVAAFFGSGKLVVDTNFNGTEKARIYGALLVRTYINESYNNYNNYVVYSDDLGENWNILGGSQTPVASGDEPKVEILPNGQILLSARRGGGRVFNVFTYTDKANNTGTWDTAANGCGNGGSNATNGEIFCVDAKKADGSAVKLLMQSQPKGGSGQYDRKDVTIWYKEIDANTTYTTATIKDNWIEGLQVSDQQSSYSAVTMQPDGKIALFFEEAPCYADDYTKGYSMVYVPLTIESITKGNYFSPSTDLEAATTIDVILTDAEGNTYNDQLTDCKVGEVATTLQTKYPFITLGGNVSLTYDGDSYTYTNMVTLPFKVSNDETTVWYNIYWPANGNNTGYPVYLSASAVNDTYVPKVTASAVYGNSSYNTAANADKISWAIYNDGLSFKLKNKLTGKFIQATSAASGNAQNVMYVDEADATAFELVPDAASYRGDYALKASVNSTVGYLCSTSATGYHYATHYTGNGHQGAWVKFAEVPEFESLITEVNTVLTQIGTSLGQYTVTDANATIAETAKTAMENSSTVKLNDLNTYKALLTGASLNMPQNGQYFRVAYDYGGNVGKLYMQATNSSVKGLQFSAETSNASIWVYYDNALYSYTEAKNLREHGNDRGLSNTKTTAEFSASTRAKGKYNIKVGSFVHANTGNGNYFTDHCSGNNCVQHDLILEEVTMRTPEVQSTIGEYKIGTFYANEAMLIPEGVTAYVALENPTMEGETGYITLTNITDGIIPAQTGVVICGEADTYNFVPSTDAGTTDASNNLLKGYAGAFESQSVALPVEATNYVLTVMEGTAGFYRKDAGFKVYNHKAYLNVPVTQDGVAMTLRLRFENNDGTTDIVELPTSQLGVQPVIYDLSGRRVQKAEKGVYIVNGKKVIF